MPSATLDQLDETAFEQILTPIWDYLAVYDKPRSADVLFVFGGLDLSVPKMAAELFLAGYAPLILTTGKSGPKTPASFGKAEALVYKDEIVRWGVDEAKVHTEVEATNTLQNVLWGMSTLHSKGVLVATAIAIARPFLSKRCIATFGQHYPDVDIISCPPRGRIINFCHRSRTQFAERLLAEIARLQEYSAKGDIRLAPIPSNVLEACDRLVKLTSANKASLGGNPFSRDVPLR